MTQAAVELRDVFRVHRTGQGDAAALQGVELDVQSGEIVCVLGPSGAGKSTLLRVIAGIETPSAGVARVLGTDIGRQPERVRARFRHRHLGLLPQSVDTALPSALTAVQAVELPLALRGHGRRERRRRAGKLLDAVGLAPRATVRMTELSGGERQRVALCGAIAHRPALLLADEPTGELDGQSADAIRRLIRQLARAAGMTVVIASHDPDMSSLVDRTLTLAGGRVAEERREAATTLVVSRGGWLRLRPADREGSGLGARVRSQLVGAAVVIEPAQAGDPASARSPERPEWSEVSAEPPVTASGPAVGPAAVEVQALARAYGRGALRRTVLGELTHRFEPATLTVVTGRSGSGKTTLLRLLAGLDRPDAGDVSVDACPLTGRDREELAALRRQCIGYMAQEPTTVEFLSALENVLLALRIRGVDGERATITAESLLAELGLAERTGQRVHRLSAGEVQRVALARAMAAARGLLILDEPTSRLDETSAELVSQLIRQAPGRGQTVICASHDPRLAEHADELLPL